MSEKIFQAQINYGWGLSLNMTDKAPAVAKRIFDTYDDALAYVNDYNDSAIEGLQLAVVADEDSKKNGVYFVEKIGTEIMTVDENGKPKGTGVAKNDGILKKVGGTETETATNYSEAKELSLGLTVGQLIRVTNEEEVDASGDSEDSDVTKIKYKAGFYIVNAPGSISALDTSTGASDEIGALSNRVATLEGNRVLTSDFEAYKTETATALAGKVDSNAFDTYKGEVTDAIGEVSTALDTYKGEVSTALDGKVSNDTLDAYKGEVTDAIGEVSSALDTYKGEVSSALDGKVSNDTLDAYKGEVSTALNGKVSNDDLDTYKGEVTDAIGEVSTALDTYKGEVSNVLDGKASTGDLSALEEKVDGDIENLKNHLTDFSGTVTDIDGRLDSLEGFVDEHIAHDAIEMSAIEGLFEPKTEA